MKLEEELAAINAKEAELTRQEEELKKKLDGLKQLKALARKEQRRLTLEKASAERQAAVAAKQAQLEEELRSISSQAEALVSNKIWWPPVDKAEKTRILTWQWEGAIKLAAAKRGILGDTRGMGKTVTAVAWRVAVGAKKTLAIMKKAYCEEFVREIRRWEPNLPILPIIGSNKIQREVLLNILAGQEEFLVVANLEMWRKDRSGLQDLKNIGFDSIIVDEAHHLKDPDSIGAKGVVELSKQVAYLLHMTGTPVQNRPQELFTLLHTSWPNLFPTKRDFVRDYCYQITQNRWTWRPGGLETLLKKMSNFFIARGPDDVGHKIPPPAIHEVELDFDGYDEQKEAYRILASQNFMAIKDRALPVFNTIAVLTRLAQLVVWPPGISVFDEELETTLTFDIRQSVKLDWAVELIEELAEENQRVVLFSRFVAPIEELAKRLKMVGVSTATITGSTNFSEKREIIRDFDIKTAPTRPKYTALLATYGTVGESANLNAATHLIQLDRFWKPSQDAQAIGRVDRLNSMEQATVYRPYVKETVDELQIEIINAKEEMLSAFSDAREMQNKLMDHLRKWV